MSHGTNRKRKIANTRIRPVENPRTVSKNGLRKRSTSIGTAHREKKCVLQREQFVWRLIDGKATYIQYRIFDLPDSRDLPTVDGARNSRCEYGIEVLITLAYLVYWTGMSIDKACGILRFFTGLDLSKSQADSLLSQLSTDWQIEYDTIAELVTAAAVLYIDETGWKVGKHSCYTWIFSTLSAVLFRCGVGRGKAVLTEVLGEKFAGIGVTGRLQCLQNAVRRASTLLGAFSA